MQIMSRTIARLSLGKSNCGSFDFVAHFALTTLSMGTEALDYADIPEFRGWIERLLKLLRLH
jgi:hypothetical protein